MTKKANDIILILAVAAVLALICALTLSFATPKTYSATVDKVNIGISADKYTSVYVSGDNVTKTENGYVAKPGAKVTVSVVNEDKIFSSVTIGGTKYTSQINEVTVPDSESFDISVETREPYAEDKGAYFGNPYLVSQEADLLALSRIFKGSASLDDYALFGESAQNVSKLAHGYFRLTTNLFVNNESFSGLGSRRLGGYPFQGCFDFGGYSITLGITRTSFVEDEFVSIDEDDVSVAEYGFFAYIYGDGNSPCIVRNAQVGGFIAINTVNSATAEGEGARVNAGGLAGTSGKNVLLDGVVSQVSVSAYTANASLSVGGVFGFCASNVEHWSDVSYEGLYSNVSGVTLGKSAKVMAGGFAGVVQNARINDFVVDVEDTNVIANSLNKESGSSIVGGFAGSLILAKSSLEEVGDPVTISVKDTTLKLNGKFAVEAVVNNSDATNKASIDPDDIGDANAGAVAGGVFGTIYRDSSLTDENVKINLSGNKFVSGVSKAAAGNKRLSVKASTADASSSGAVFAGGYTGYIYTKGVENIYRELNEENREEENERYIFDCAMDVVATQNGIGPAYAGGLFGYNAYVVTSESEQVQCHVCSNKYDYNVSAVQSSSSSKTGNVMYDVAAGGFSSKLYSGYSLQNVVFDLGNCNIKAYREAGSTAIGDIASGGFVGMATNSVTKFGKHSSTQSGNIDNLTLSFEENSTIEAACYSFDSDATNGTGSQSEVGNNVYGGGVIGLVVGYLNVSNVIAQYEYRGGTHNEYFVHVIQNAVSGNADLASEGFVGGMFGIMMDTTSANLQLVGEESEGSLVYLESNNNPNTASVGGLIGAVWAWWLSQTEFIDGALVKNIHVAGKGYHTVSNDEYDIYVGGAIGISGNQKKGNANAGNKLVGIVVDNCKVESIGENQMLTYAAGIVGGIWWAYAQYLQDSVVVNSSVTSSSVSQKSYAAGVTGIAQQAYISGCAVIDTDIRAISPNNEAAAFGIFSWSKGYYSVTGNYSNATLKAEGKSGSSYYAGIGHPQYAATDGNYNKPMYANVSVAENAGTDTIYQNSSRYPNAKGAALYLDESKNNRIELANLKDTQKVYPMAYLAVGSGTSSANGFVVDVKSSNESVATVSKNSDGYYYVTAVGKGVAYVSAWCSVNGKEYQLCTYPVFVQGGEDTTSFALDVTDANGNSLDENNVNALCDYEDGTLHYRYVKRLVGDPDTADAFSVTPIVNGTSGVFPTEATLYDVKADDSWSEDPQSRVASIIANKGSKVERSSFNGRMTIATTGEVGARTKVSVSVKNSISSTVIMVLEYVVNGETYGVITEFVPNEIVGIDLTPDSETPAHDIVTVGGKTYYVYAPGDVVRFNAKTVRRFSDTREYVVETSFSGDGVTPNGTVVVSKDKDTYEVKCATIDGSASATAYILVRKQVTVTPSLNGAVFSASQKLINGSTYNFSVAPQAGYGLRPTIFLTINDVKYECEFVENGAQLSYGGTTYLLTAVKSDVDGSYGFEMSGELTTAIANDADSITIGASFNKTYEYVFVSNYGDNEAFRIEVASGTPLKDFDTTDFDAWTKTLKRYGFELQGFYLVSEASNLSDFGKSFDEMKQSDAEYANGFLKFYARWTYSVVTQSPSSVEVKSSFSQGALQDGDMIPVSEKSGFGFSLELCDGYIGSPRFDAYIRLEDGTYVSITDLFEKDALENSFYASYAKLSEYESGLIYVRVYADDLEFFVGDDVKYDGNKLYSDGIFTLEYSVNYGSSDSVKDIESAFSSPLPKGTALRVYYQKDGVAVWAGGFALDEATSKIAVSSFKSMYDGSALQNSFRQGARSEKFALVVTLPNNTDSFGSRGGFDLTAYVDGYEYAATTAKYGEYAQSVEDAPTDAVPDSKQTAVVYSATRHAVSVDASGNLSYTVTDNAVEGVTDHRHQGSSYMFKVELTAGGAIGDVTFDFIGTETVRTTTAVYFVATSGTTFSTEQLKGYTLSLVETRNAQQPAEGKTLFSQSF